MIAKAEPGVSRSDARPGNEMGAAMNELAQDTVGATLSLKNMPERSVARFTVRNIHRQMQCAGTCRRDLDGPEIREALCRLGNGRSAGAPSGRRGHSVAVQSAPCLHFACCNWCRVHGFVTPGMEADYGSCLESGGTAPLIIMSPKNAPIFLARSSNAGILSASLHSPCLGMM